jgi:hypothetical protein
MVVDADGNVHVTGESGEFVFYSDYATVKYNCSGILLWAARYDGSAAGDDHASAIAVDGDRNVYVTGYSDGLGVGRDYATVKYSSSGVEQWVARYDGPASSHDAATDIAVCDGSVFVTGESRGSGTGYDYATLKYSAAGVGEKSSIEDGKTQTLGIEVYPNPFPRTTTIRYSVPRTARVSLKVFDVTGRCVKTLVSGEKNPGYHDAEFQSKDLRPGIYFARFEAYPIDGGQARDHKEVRKLILMR